MASPRLIKVDADNASYVWRFVLQALSQMGLRRLSNPVMCGEIEGYGPVRAGDMAWDAAVARVEDMVWVAVVVWADVGEG